MNIQTRILLGHGYLITLLVIAAGGAAVGFHDFARTVGVVLSENFASVKHAMAMLEALAEHEGAIAAGLLGDAEAQAEGRAGVKASEAKFQQALSAAQANVTLPEERKILADLFSRFETFKEVRDRLIEAPPTLPLQAYTRDARPHFAAIKSDLLQLLDVNHRAMISADEALSERASDRATLLGLLVTLALLSLAFLSRELRRVVLRRLGALREVAEAIAAGDRSRRAATVPNDELGVVAAELNRALDAQQQIALAMGGRMAHQRRVVLALLDRRDHPAAVVSPTGDLVASTLDPKQTRVAERAAAELRKEEHPEPGAPVRSIEGWEVTFEPLIAPGRKPAGYLVTVATAAEEPIAEAAGEVGGRPAESAAGASGKERAKEPGDGSA